MAELTIPGYHIQSCIHSSVYGGIYRAINTQSQQSVILKVAKKTQASAEHLEQLRNEHEILTSLTELETVPTIINFIDEGNCLALELAHFSGETLDSLLNQQALTQEDSVAVISSCLNTLDAIHKLHIIHKDIKPSNILWDKEKNKVWLIDFGLAIRFNQKLDQFHQPTSVSGSLSYMPPEQTGRINRFIDYRSDYYSLGVTFYQLLTGKLPFNKAETTHDFLYQLLSTEATAPHVIAPNVSKSLSDIVMHFLEKDPENRYQSILGISHDLSCYQKAASFVVAEKDSSGHFSIPSHVYGRDKELSQLREIFAKVKAGSQEYVLIDGYSGVGKTALVNELYRDINNAKGFLIEGKFDQLQRQEPLFGFIKAFNEFFSAILTESDATLAHWKTVIEQNLGENIGVVTQHIQKLELLLGTQPTPLYLAGEEGFNRLIFSFESLINCIASDEHPLVMFIDDLQWVDDASLKLIEKLLYIDNTPNCLLIGAYRDNEVNAGHPLHDFISRSVENKTKLKQLSLKNLSPNALTQILKDGFKQKISGIDSLSELIYSKTGGNPYFTIQFIHKLIDEKLISLTSSGDWVYDLERISTQSIADNLVDLMQDKIIALPSETSELLSAAAIIGHEFELSTLQLITDDSINVVRKSLLPALQNELIIATQNYFRFAHDGIQEAALQNINSSIQNDLHLKLGEILLDKRAKNFTQSNADIFTICFHLNAAQVENLSSVARKQHIELNLEAAIKAKLSAAYDASLSYMTITTELFTKADTDTQNVLGYAVYKEAAECAFLCSNSDLGNKYIALAEPFTVENHQRFQLIDLRVKNLVLLGEYVKSMELGISALRLYDIDLPDVNDEDSIDEYYNNQEQWFANHWTKQNKDIADLYHLPVNTNEEAEQLMALLGELYASALMSFPNYLKAITITLVNLSVKNGNTPTSPVAYAWHGSSIAAISDDYDDAFAFGELAIRLNEERIKNATIACKIYNMVGNFITFFKKPLRQTLPQLRRAYELGMSSGDKLYGGYSIINELRNCLSTGINLNNWLNLDEEIKLKLNQCDAFVMVEVRESFKSHALRLIGKSNTTDVLDNESFCEQTYREKYTAVPLFGVLLDSWKIQSDYLLDCYQQALAISLFDVTPIDSFVLGSEMRFFAALTLLHFRGEQTNALNDEEKEQHINKYMSRIEVLSQHCIENFGHLSEILKAEHKRTSGENWQAARHFEKAIELAKQNEYLQYEALANELLGKLYLSMQLKQAGQNHIARAYELYGHWGSVAKQRLLESQYVHLTQIQTSQHRNSPTSSGLISKNEITHRINLKSIIDASLALSSEVDLEALLNQLIDIALKSTGAQRCVLLLPEQNDWLVAMEQDGTAPQTSIMQMSSPQHKLPLSILNYVVHSGEDVILNNAMSHKLYGNDEYVNRHLCKSIICLPLVHQNNTRAIIYLENNLSSNLFTQEKSSRLKLLSAQMAASIQNAENYQDLKESKHELNELNLSLEHKVKERTLELENALSKLQNSQQQLVEQEKLASLGRLVAGVAHEVNTPLGVAVLANSVVLSSIKELNQKFDTHSLSKNDLTTFLKKTQDASGQVGNNLERANALVNNFKQMANDYHSDPLTEINLADWLNSLSGSLKLMLKRPRIDLRIDAPEKTIVLKTYPTRLAQVVTNLVSNAIRHAFPKELNKDDKLITITLQAHSSEYAIAVSDNGIGMDEETQKRMLDPFFTTNRASGGMGLGMSIVHNLVTSSLKGRLDVSSEKEQGTTITVYFSAL